VNFGQLPKSLNRVRTDIKILFPGLANTKFQVLPGLQNFFQALSRARSIQKHGFHEVKNVHIQNQLALSALQ